MTAATTTRAAKTQVAKAIEKARVSSTGSAAYSLGKNMGAAAKRLTAEDTDSTHRAYVKANDARKEEIRNDYCIGYMQAFLAVSRDVAETVWSQKRTERSAPHQRGADAAQKSFRFHIVRPEGGKGAGAKAKVRVPSEFKAKAIMFIEREWETCNAASLKECAALLLAMAKSMK